MEKPIELVIRETRESIVKILNDSKLPSFIVKPIMKDLYMEITNLEESQYQAAKRKYEDSLEESEHE